jgi:hypothetical protein
MAVDKRLIYLIGTLFWGYMALNGYLYPPDRDDLPSFPFSLWLFLGGCIINFNMLRSGHEFGWGDRINRLLWWLYFVAALITAILIYPQIEWW